MVTPETVFTLTIPEWENKVFNGVVIAKYYSKKDKLPIKYKGAPLRRFGRESYYVDETGKKLVKNKGSIGKKLYLIPNGQLIYNGGMHWTERVTVVDFYHRYFGKFIKKIFKEPIPVFLSYSVSMEVTFYELLDHKTPDITNQWLIVKIIEDVFKDLKILKDDSPEFRRKTSFGYEAVNKEEDRKLVVKFKYKRNNECKEENIEK